MEQTGAKHKLIVKKGAGHESFHTEKSTWDFFATNLKNSLWKRVRSWLGLE
jgi:hypothetical protein